MATLITTPEGYHIRVRPRWGHGLDSNWPICRALEGYRENYERALEEIEACSAALHDIPQDPDPHNPLSPFWNNVWFSTLDAASLVAFIISRRPSRYVEIGSGHSTMFARYAIEIAGSKTTLISIDPKPRAGIDDLCDEVVRSPLEDCDIALFEKLREGDILFFDGSHSLYANSDVVVFFLEILPHLGPGVLVHIHDIFLPDDYPPAWEARLYNEQYILGAMLLCGSLPFRVLLSNYFVSRDMRLGFRVSEIFKGKGSRKSIPLAYANAAKTPGVSFWLESIACRSH